MTETGRALQGMIMVVTRIVAACARGRLWSVAALAATSLMPPAAHADTLATWVELIGKKGEASIRAIVSGTDQCPVLTGGPQMKVRADPDGANGLFPVRICEAVIAPGTRDVQLDGKALPLPRKDIRRIVVFGDTGCRLKGDKIQDCATAWPYAQLAQHAADAKPDLVIHVGDYLYREPPCSPGGQGICPTDYGWNGWNADFFAPSQPLFAAAPWIMVRGNHEICDRAGAGWFRFLDHAAFNPTCVTMSDFFVVKAGGLGFVVIDNASLAHEKETAVADADDDDDEEDVNEEKPAGTVAGLQKRWKRIANDVPDNAWLLGHVTFNAVREAHGKTEVDNTVQQTALGGKPLAKIQMIISGHIHMFEGISFAKNKPPQLVVGTGGTKLAHKPDIPPTINGLNVSQSKSIVEKDFGYMVWERDKKNGSKWAGILFDQSGDLLATCTLDGRDLRCKKDKKKDKQS